MTEYQGVGDREQPIDDRRNDRALVADGRRQLMVVLRWSV